MSADQVSSAVPDPFEAQPLFDAQPFDAQPFDAQPYDAEQFDPQPYDAEQFDPQPYDAEQFDPQPYDAQPFDGQPAPAPAAAAPGAAAPARGSKGRHAGPAVGPALPVQQDVASGLRRLVAAARSTPLATTGLAILAATAVFCFIGPALYHTDQVHVFLTQANLSPRAGHPLGTDRDGNDELGRLMVGGQVSLEVGAAAGVLAAILGSLWGAISGYAGGYLDAVMMRVVDAGLAIPTVVVLLVVVTIYRPTEPVLVLVIAATSWLSTARLVRAEALTLRTREFVQAIRVMGGGSLRAVLRHIAPNAFGTIVVNVSFQIANAILTLAILSYLGLGIQSPAVDWGDMIFDAVQSIDLGYWWQVVPPGLAIMLVVAALTMVGDGLRDGLSREGR
jgi:peptide/nickel transport system permease protein